MPVRTGKSVAKKVDKVEVAQEVETPKTVRRAPTRKAETEAEAPKVEAPKKTVAKRPSRAKAPEVKEEADEVGETTIKKSILETNVKKFITKVAPELLDKVNDVFERAISDSGSGEKNNVLFLAFSTNGVDDDEVDDAFNIECIKTLLFAYHTDEEKPGKGKILFAEVMPPKDAGSPHILCFQEVSVVQ